MAVTSRNGGAGLIGRRSPVGAETVKVKITRATIARGAHAPVGEILALERREALVLFAAGKAIPWAEQIELPVVREEPPMVRDGEADPGQNTASAGPACRDCGQDLTDRRRKRVEVEGGILCARCAKVSKE